MTPDMRQRIQQRLTQNIALVRDLASRKNADFDSKLRLYKIMARIQADTAALNESIPDDLIRFVA